MTIQQSCYNLSKKIWELPIISSVRSVIESLNKVEKEDIGSIKDRGLFGYVARKQGAQFMGYLIADHKRDDYEKKNQMKLPDITGDELVIIRKAHAIIQNLDMILVADITEKIKNLKKALNPYSLYNYPHFEYNINDLVDISIFDEIIEVFSNCELIKRIKSIPIVIAEKVTEEHYMSTVYTFIKKIESYGVHETPRDFDEFALLKKGNQDVRSITELLLLVMSLRKIITNINQFIYQAFLYDKLVVLNEDNIINVLHNNRHLIGNGLSILIQPSGNELLTELGDIVLVRLEESNINTLGVVEGLKNSFSQEFGQTMEFSLRSIDENLNPYHGLVNDYIAV